MQLADAQDLISQSTYAKKIRPLLPREAFLPDTSKLFILIINLAMLVIGWMIAAQLDSWPLYSLFAYLPIAILMGNSIVLLIFFSHDFLHGSIVRNAKIVYCVGFVGLTICWMPPTLWKTLHNRIHHNKTNSLDDPDRNYLHSQPNTLVKWMQSLALPSIDVNPIGLAFGMLTVWVSYVLRNLISVLFLNRKGIDFIPASFVISNEDRLIIASEFLVMLAIHSSIFLYLQFNPIKIFLGYFVPVAIGYSVIIFYIYTQHLICRMTSVNDPLINSVSIRVPKIFDLLHLNFSFHTEHHVFPGMNSDYYPMVQELLKIHYPERLNILTAAEAWSLLMRTHRHYKDENTLTDWTGTKTVNCPLSSPILD